jgi:hypothetical protein
VHSFIDGQLVFGLDDFENSYDWLFYTLAYLKKKNKRVIIKAHPNYFNTSLSKDLTDADKKVFDLLYYKFRDYEGFYFIRYPVKNCDFAKNLNKKTICLTHHGSVLIELALQGFKTISSSATFFSEKFQISNFWKNKKQYSDLLNKNWIYLKKPLLKDLYHLAYKLFIHKDYCNGKNSYKEVIATKLKKDLSMLTKKNQPFHHLSNQKILFEKNFSQKQLKNIIKELGQKIIII